LAVAVERAGAGAIFKWEPTPMNPPEEMSAYLAWPDCMSMMKFLMTPSFFAVGVLNCQANEPMDQITLEFSIVSLMGVVWHEAEVGREKKRHKRSRSSAPFQQFS